MELALRARINNKFIFINPIYIIFTNLFTNSHLFLSYLFAKWQNPNVCILYYVIFNLWNNILFTIALIFKYLIKQIIQIIIICKNIIKIMFNINCK
jgi:hypothetical protein